MKSFDNGIEVVALGDLDVLEAKLVDEGGDNDLTDMVEREEKKWAEAVKLGDVELVKGRA